MNTAVIGEEPDGRSSTIARSSIWPPPLRLSAARVSSLSSQDQGKVEPPFRYIREDFFLGGSFRDLDDPNGQLRDSLETVANPRVHVTTRRVAAREHYGPSF